MTLIIIFCPRYCDEQFVKAQAKELAEAANLSNQQFNSAAKQLLEREKAGEIELPMTNRGTYRYVDFSKSICYSFIFFLQIIATGGLGSSGLCGEVSRL